MQLWLHEVVKSLYQHFASGAASNTNPNSNVGNLAGRNPNLGSAGNAAGQAAGGRGASAAWPSSITINQHGPLLIADLLFVSRNLRLPSSSTSNSSGPLSEPLGAVIKRELDAVVALKVDVDGGMGFQHAGTLAPVGIFLGIAVHKCRWIVGFVNFSERCLGLSGVMFAS